MMVVTGTAGAQVVAMLFMPFITRLYGPEAFGLLGSFVSIASILMPMAALTYPIAIVLPERHSDAIKLSKLSVLISIVTSSVVAITFCLFGEKLAALLQLEDFVLFIMLVPVAMLFSGLHQIAEQWVVRLRLYKQSAIVALFQAVIVNTARVVGGLYNPIALTLIGLQVFASALHGGLLFIGLLKNTNNVGEKATASSDSLSIRAVACKYKDFAIYRAPQVTMNAASVSLPILMLMFYFGPAFAGFYALSKTVVSIPSLLLGKAVGDVLYPRISDAANNNEKLYPVVKKATILLALVACIPFLVVILFGPFLFAIFFGEEWRPAGSYARWLAGWMYITLLSTPAVKALPVLAAQKFHLVHTVVVILIRVLALFIGYQLFSSDLISVALYSLTGCILNLMLVLWVLRLCVKFDGSASKC
jgi:O-antigen/teichoic acid export membrane protein